MNSAAFILAFSCIAQVAAAQAPARHTDDVLARHYRDGESVAYQLTATNQQGAQTTTYEADAHGTVKQDASGTCQTLVAGPCPGRWYEEIAWSNLIWNHEAVKLAPASINFRELLSLDPEYKLSIPNLSQVDPRLIGPITDLLTFYSDFTLAMRQPEFTHAGAHVYFQHGTPNSWADGNYVLTGEDSIDFDLTLAAVSPSDHTAWIKVRHVPPQKPQIKLAATWMQTPVSDTPNNWVMVSKGQNGKFNAQIGKETFDVRLEVDTNTGRILFASMDNPVKVLQRECSDATLTRCGDPVRFDIHRQIQLHAIDLSPGVGSRLKNRR